MTHVFAGEDEQTDNGSRAIHVNPNGRISMLTQSRGDNEFGCVAAIYGDTSGKGLRHFTGEAG